MISRGRDYICTAHSITPKSLSLHDINAYFDVYGCDLDKGLFVECIFALDNKFIESSANKT